MKIYNTVVYIKYFYNENDFSFVFIVIYCNNIDGLTNLTASNIEYTIMHLSFLKMRKIRF
jgi:hypothetical protein